MVATDSLHHCQWMCRVACGRQALTPRHTQKRGAAATRDAAPAWRLQHRQRHCRPSKKQSKMGWELPWQQWPWRARCRMTSLPRTAMTMAATPRWLRQLILINTTISRQLPGSSQYKLLNRFTFTRGTASSAHHTRVRSCHRRRHGGHQRRRSAAARTGACATPAAAPSPALSAPYSPARRGASLAA